MVVGSFVVAAAVVSFVGRWWLACASLIDSVGPLTGSVGPGSLAGF